MAIWRYLCCWRELILHGVAASADGVRMYAVSGTGVGVYGSSDSGQTWAQVRAAPARLVFRDPIFPSLVPPTEKIVYAEPFSGGTIEKSTNYGVNWADTTSSATGTFISLFGGSGARFFQIITHAPAMERIWQK